MPHPPKNDERHVPSTGFLPLSLALTLFISGLFALGFVEVPSCNRTASTPAR